MRGRTGGKVPLAALWAFLLVVGAPRSPLPAQDQAVDEVFRYPLNGETLPRFQEICAELSKYPVIKGTFEQVKRINRLNRSLVSQGSFIIAPELGMVWETLRPFPSTMAVGRDYLVQSVPSGAKTRLDARGNETFLRLADTLSAIFTGNSRQLLDNFENYFRLSGTAWTVGLVPRERSIRSVAERIVMTGDLGGPPEKGPPAVIRSITLYEQSGDTVRYTLGGHSFPRDLTAAERDLFRAP